MCTQGGAGQPRYEPLGGGLERRANPERAASERHPQDAHLARAPEGLQPQGGLLRHGSWRREHERASARVEACQIGDELLEVIRKYVNVDPEAVVINLERDQGQEVLELTVALPEKIQGSKKATGTAAKT